MFNQFKSTKVGMLWSKENGKRFLFETKNYGSKDYYYRNNPEEHLA